MDDYWRDDMFSENIINKNIKYTVGDLCVVCELMLCVN